MLRAVAPDKRVLAGSVSPDPDTTFQASWLIDGRPSYPYQKMAGISATVTPDAARNYDVVGVARHLIAAAGTVTIDGHVVTIPAYGGDGLPRSAATVLATPANTGASFSVSTSGTLIGDLWVGESILLPDFQWQRSLTPGELVPWEAALAPYIDGYSEIKSVTGLINCTQAQYNSVVRWRESTRKGVLPSFVIFYTGEVWLCLMNYTDVHEERHYQVNLTLVQIPDTDW